MADYLNDEDEEQHFLARYEPLGDGSNEGDHNITVFVEDGIAKLRVIKKTSSGVEERAIIDLSKNTAKISVGTIDSRDILFVSPEDLNRSFPINYALFISETFDLKVSEHFPDNSTSIAIVGAEDPRDGIRMREAIHAIHLLPLYHVKMRIYQSSSNPLTLKIGVQEGGNAQLKKFPYLKPDGSSASGVKFWGKEFEHFYGD
jgi:hypothetical protein